MSKKKKGKASAADGISIAGHPRARHWIRRARAIAALAAFVLVILLCRRAGVAGQTALARALIAGVAGYLVAWAAGISLWRSIVMAELRAEHAARQARRRAALEAARADS